MHIAYGASALMIVVGCGGDMDMEGAGLPGSANVLHGPSSPSGPAQAATGPNRAAADGRWQVSPDRSRTTLLGVDFFGEAAGTDQASVFEDCIVSWDRGDAALSPLLTCDFTVPPGTYIGMSVGVSTTFEVLIDDAVNGLFTDPAAPSGLATVAPTGGAEFVDFVVPGPGGSGDRLDFHTYFTSPLVVTADEPGPIEINLVVDMTHTIEIDVAAGMPSFRSDFVPVPLFLFGTVAEVGKATFYTDLGTAANVLESFPPNTMRFFYGADDQPAFVWAGAATAGCQVGDTPSNAWNTSPSESPVQQDGSRTGGFLGLDGAGSLCWALPQDATWDTYATLFTMPEAGAVGSTSSMSCQRTGSVPDPTSGSSYASGCPIVAATGSATLTLVAD